MKKDGRLFLLQYLVQSGGLVFANVLRHCFYAATENPLSELYLDDVTDLEIIGRLDHAGVYHNVTFAAGVVCHGASLDDAGYLQKFVESHSIFRDQAIPYPFWLMLCFSILLGEK